MSCGPRHVWTEGARARAATSPGRTSGRARSVALWTTAIAALLSTSCAGPGTLAAGAREVVVAAASLEWVPGAVDDVPGLYSSVSIDGPAAAVLHEVHYRFDSDGTFTGAALVTSPSHAYTVLTGEWRVDADLLFLSEDGEPARIEVSGDLVRFTGTEGVVVLRRRSVP